MLGSCVRDGRHGPAMGETECEVPRLLEGTSSRVMPLVRNQSYCEYLTGTFSKYETSVSRKSCVLRMKGMM